MAADEMRELAIVPAAPRGMIAPLVTPTEAKESIARYERLKAAIVRDEDKIAVQGRTFLKKSFWRRVASCFGVSLELAREEYLTEIESTVYGYSVVYRAVAPSGQSMEGDGLCMSNEKPGMTRHTVRATAHTRAKNRAISDLVGGGEVSAEEVHYDDSRVVESRAPQRSPLKPAPKPPANGFAQFLEDLKALGISPVQAMDRLGKKTLAGLDYPSALAVLRGDETPDLAEVDTSTVRP